MPSCSPGPQPAVVYATSAELPDILRATADNLLASWDWADRAADCLDQMAKAAGR